MNLALNFSFRRFKKKLEKKYLFAKDGRKSTVIVSDEKIFIDVEQFADTN